MTMHEHGVAARYLVITPMVSPTGMTMHEHGVAARYLVITPLVSPLTY